MGLAGLGALSAMAAAAALILPAVTLTGVHPAIAAEQTIAWSGDALSVSVSARAEPFGGRKTIVLSSAGEGADLSPSYLFQEDGICTITDEEGREIELHRTVGEDPDAAVNYWFILEAGTAAAFTLDFIDEEDAARFAETAEAVRRFSADTDDIYVSASASDAVSAALSETDFSFGRAADDRRATRSDALWETSTASDALRERGQVLLEADDDGFLRLLDGDIINDLRLEAAEESPTEIVAELLLSAGIGQDYAEAVRDAGRNADKRGDAQVKLRWEDITENGAAETQLSASVNGAYIALIFDDAAGIPEDAVLLAEEIEEDSSIYQEYLTRTRDTLSDGFRRRVSEARYFDLTIRDGSGREVEPQSPVRVVITCDDAFPSGDPEGEMNVLHFDGEIPEIIQPGILEDGSDGRISALRFTAESFSVYGVVYTVDFTYEVDGKSFFFSMDGGGVASLGEIIERLHLCGEEMRPEEFLAHVEQVLFSGGDCLRVVPVSEDTTFGQLAEREEITPSCSPVLTEEDIQESLSAAVCAGDWALFSEGPFDSEEQLSIRMDNGESFALQVRDPAEEAPAESEIPRQADGSNIEAVSARWITPDTVDNGDASLLYLQPAKDETQTVRLQINYALSGEHNYEPGDVTITVPAEIFKDRQGNVCGTMIVPYPEEPSVNGDFNWKQVGDRIILTNTRAMSAATKGYIQFSFEELVPHELVDMEVSAPFDAYVEVMTHRGRTIALRSNALTAQIDTGAMVRSAVKKVSGSPRRVSADQIPAEQRIEGETEYIWVDWYVWGTTQANTMYTLDLTDSIPQDQVVVTGDDGTELTEADFHGFLIRNAEADGVLSEHGTVLTQEAVYSGHRDGMSSYYYFSTAYPASQFQPDITYTFHNSVLLRVTEADPEALITNPNVNGGEDLQLVTTAHASARTAWQYSDPKWVRPTGHFMVFKNGNDDTAGRNRTHKSSPVRERSDLHLWYSPGYEGWYGLYPSGMNELQEQYEESGTEGGIRLSYTMNSVGYVMPWMFDSGAEKTDGAIASRLSRNYRLPVTMVTEETGLSVGRDGEKLSVPGDYTFLAVEFPDEPYIYAGVPRNINPDGSWRAMNAGDGTFQYSRDSDRSHWPEITLQLLRNGSWETYASVNWQGGSFTAELANGEETTEHVIPLPPDTESFRTLVTLQNNQDSAAAELNQCLQAAIDYDVRAVVRLKSTEAMMSLVASGFAGSSQPSLNIWNGACMKAYEAPDLESAGDALVRVDADGYDVVQGYTTDVMVYPSKKSRQTIQDVDYERRLVTVHYSAEVEERSVIHDRKTYVEAVAEGRLAAETGGIWRDLLPKGMSPVIQSIQLRSGDSVTAVYTEENFRGSGRTLLTVEADLTPQPKTYRSGGMTYFEDVPSIQFDAVYGFDELIDYGEDLHNVISFESDREFIGTVEGFCGEPDDPEGGGNRSSAAAFRTEEEKKTVKDLDPLRDTPSFVYAGADTRIDIISAARTSLNKEVQVNGDGLWGTGLYYDDPEENRKTVYEGGYYSYRLRMMSDADTISKDLILYDALEDYEAVDGNDGIDIGAPRWRGSLVSVDVSQLEDQGCAPVVYFSTVAGLRLSDEADREKGNAVNMDLTNESIWVEASDYGGEIGDVRAVAVDARKTTDGEDFVLEPLESATVILNLRAPEGEEAAEYIRQKGTWGDSANAYNNVYLLCTSIDTDTGDADSDNFVRKDYTKVGLTPYRYDVEKRWDDGNNRDGLRPETVVVHLFADGTDTGRELILPVIRIDPETGERTEIWKGYFEDIPYTDPDGKKVNYSVREEVPAGYGAFLTIGSEHSAVITNRHTPETTTVSGEKLWVGDSAETRPESIQVTLLADGEAVRSMTVKPDVDGKWSYAFTDLYKYRDGHEIIYTVEETMPENGQLYLSSVERVSAEGEAPVYNIVNEYHPKGQLSVEKTLLGATAVSREQEFSFTFVFTISEDGESAPVKTEYPYTIYDADGMEIALPDNRIQTVSTNGIIRIRGGQRILVREIEEGVNYTVTEETIPGFHLSASSGTEGAILPNEVQEARFINTYTAAGTLQIAAEKILFDREILRGQFRLGLYEVIDGTDEESGEAAVTERLVRTASCDASETTVVRGDGTVEYSAASVTFGMLRYTQEDAGKTFLYRVREMDLKKDGYFYDETVYAVKVEVTDAGNGKLNAAATYYRIGADNSLAEVSEMKFHNRYQAKGQISLTAWKTLRGRSLTDGAFTFDLLNEEGEIVGTAASSASGIIRFLPDGPDGEEGTPDDITALVFDEKSIGRTYYFAVREHSGDEGDWQDIVYDSRVFGYGIQVFDNGDGTLSFRQTTVKPVLEEETGRIVSWEPAEEMPVFVNTPKDGGFSVSKYAVWSGEEVPDPAEEFHFWIRLIGDEIPDGRIQYELLQIGGEDGTGEESSGAGK